MFSWHWAGDPVRHFVTDPFKDYATPPSVKIYEPVRECLTKYAEKNGWKIIPYRPREFEQEKENVKVNVAKQILEQFFNKSSADVYLIWYQGHGDASSGGWSFDGGTLQFDDIADIWMNSLLAKGKTLAIISDSCYSGHWEKHAQSFANSYPSSPFVLQMSSQSWQYSWNDEQTGSGVFIDTWVAIHENANIDAIQKQGMNINTFVNQNSKLKVKVTSQVPSIFVNGTPLIPFYLFGSTTSGYSKSQTMSVYPPKGEYLDLPKHWKNNSVRM